LRGVLGIRKPRNSATTEIYNAVAEAGVVWWPYFDMSILLDSENTKTIFDFRYRYNSCDGG